MPPLYLWNGCGLGGPAPQSPFCNFLQHFLGGLGNVAASFRPWVNWRLCWFDTIRDIDLLLTHYWRHVARIVCTNRLHYIFRIKLCPDKLLSNRPATNPYIFQPRNAAEKAMDESYTTPLPVPWANESIMTQLLLTDGGVNGKSRFHGIDPWHMIHLGIGKSWIGSGVMLLQKTIGESNVDKRIAVISSEYRAFLQKRGSRSHFEANGCAHIRWKDIRPKRNLEQSCSHLQFLTFSGRLHEEKCWSSFGGSPASGVRFFPESYNLI